MTAQAPDILLFNGETLPLFTNPLDTYLGELGRGWPFASSSTANWRGYVATWEIRDGVLLLVRIRGWLAKHPIDVRTPSEIRLKENLVALPDEYQEVLRKGDPPDIARLEEPEVALSRLFPGNAGPVKASWYSGTLRIPRGDLVHYVHMGYESVYEREVLLTIEHGIVTDFEEVDSAEQARQRALDAKERLEEARPTTVDDWGWAPCPHCGQAFCVRDKKHWDGQRHWCGGRIVLRNGGG